MPTESERYNFRVGDRVRDKQTGKEGRVQNIVAMSRDTLLVAVTLFAGGGTAVVGTVRVLVKRGQVSGQRLEKLDPGPVSAVAAQAAAGGQAKVQAAQNRPATVTGGTDRELLRDRLIQRHLPFDNENARLTAEGRKALLRKMIADAEAGPIRGDLQRELTRLEGASVAGSFQLGELNGLGADGFDRRLRQFRESQARLDLSDETIKKAVKLRRTAPASASSAAGGSWSWGRLLDLREETGRMLGGIHRIHDPAEATEQIYRIRQNLNQLEKHHAFYEKEQDQLLRVRRWLDDQFTIVSQQPGVASRLETWVQNSDFQNLPRFQFQLHDHYAKQERAFDLLQEGYAEKTGFLDLTDAQRNRELQYRSRTGGLAPRGNLGARHVGEDPLFLNQRASLPGPPTRTGSFPLGDYLWNETDVVGRVVQYNRVPHRITHLDRATRQVRMVPLQTHVPLYTTMPLHDGSAVNGLLDAAAERHRLAVRKPDETVYRIALRDPRKVLDGKLGTTDVRVSRLFEHLFGTRRIDWFGEAGWATFSDARLKKLIPWEALRSRHLSQQLSAEDRREILAKARALVLEELTDPARAPGYEGKSIQAIERQLQQVLVQRLETRHHEDLRLLSGIGDTVLEQRVREGFAATKELEYDVFDHVGEDMSLSRTRMSTVLTREEFRDLPERFGRIRPFFGSDTEALQFLTGSELGGTEAADAALQLRQLRELSGRRGRQFQEVQVREPYKDHVPLLTQRSMSVPDRRRQLRGNLREALGVQVVAVDPAARQEYQELAALRRQRDLILLRQEIDRLEQSLQGGAAIERKRQLLELMGLRGPQLLDPKRRQQKFAELDALLAQADQIFAKTQVAETAWQRSKARELAALEREGRVALAYGLGQNQAAHSERLRQLWATIDMQRLNPQQLDHYREAFDALLDLYSLGGEAAVPAEFRHFVATGPGGLGIKLTTRPGGEGETWIYHRGGIVRSQADPQRFMLMSNEAPGTTVSFEEFTKQVHTSHLRSNGLTYQMERQARTEQLFYAVRGQEGLGVYVGQGQTPLGFHGREEVNWSSVAERTRKLVDPKTKSFISLDIETHTFRTAAGREKAAAARQRLGRDVVEGEVHNIAAVRYARDAEGRFVPKGQINLAVETLSPYAAQVAQQGGQLLKSEREMLAAMELYLRQNPGTVAGHNIAFDALGMLKRARELKLSPEQVKTFTHVAERRVADTLLLSQAALPKVQMYGLEWLAQSHLGLGAGFQEAHRALEDAFLAGRLVNSFQNPESARTVQEAFRGARELKLRSGSILAPEITGTVLWDANRKRAFEFMGSVDPSAAEEALRNAARSVGKDPQEAGALFGIALRPLDSTRPGSASTLPASLVYEVYGQPQTFARQFSSRYEPITAAEAATRMEARAQDLARRRVRRMLQGENAFEHLLLERERFELITGNASPEAFVKRFNESTNPVERNLLERTAQWVNNYSGDSQIRRQLQLEADFWKHEVGELHAPVVETLENWVKQADPQSRPTLMRQASTVWETYLQQAKAHVGEFARIENPGLAAEERHLSFFMDVLGGNRAAVRIGNVHQAEQDLKGIAFRVAKKLGPEESARLIGAGDPGAQQFRELFEHPRLLWDTQPGEQLIQQIWQRHLRPALREGGFVQLHQETGMRLRLRSSTLTEGIQELVHRGGEHAQSMAAHITDPLAARKPATVPEGLKQLHQQIRDQGVEQLLAAQAGQQVDFGLHHGVPPRWAGRSFQDVIQEAASHPGTDEQTFLRTLRAARYRMNAAEAQSLHGTLKAVKPEWAERLWPHYRRRPSAPSLPHLSPGTPKIPVSPPPVPPPLGETAFRPSKLQTAGMRLGEAVEHGGGNAWKLAGMGALALMGSTLLIAGLNRPAAPAAEEPQPSGFASGPGEQERRREVVRRRLPQHHQLSVRIEGDDPLGLDHDELTQSIHAALSGHFAQPLPAGKTHVNNHRREVNRSFLEEIGSQLLQNSPP